MSKGLLTACIVAAVLAVSASAQTADSVVLSYQRNFARSNLGTKLDLVRDAAKVDGGAFGALYEQALIFALQNVELLAGDPLLVDLAAEAAHGCGDNGSKESLQSLWRVFMAFRDAKTRVAVLGALSKLGKGDGQVVENLNQYLATQNNVFRSGLAPDLDTLSACIFALGTLDDGASFPVLFSTMIAGYPDAVASQARDALKSIHGDYKKYLIDVMRRNSPREKLAAFRAGIINDTFDSAARGELAEAALGIALPLVLSDPAEAALVRELRYAAVKELTAERWTKATDLVLKHFYLVQTDFGKGQATQKEFVEAINALGAMANSDAAQALSLQLGIVNAEMERTKTFDAEVLSALIEAVGVIGDKVAFDYLLYIGYLPYPDDIKALSRIALNRLKW